MPRTGTVLRRVATNLGCVTAAVALVARVEGQCTFLYEIDPVSSTRTQPTRSKYNPQLRPIDHASHLACPFASPYPVQALRVGD